MNNIEQLKRKVEAMRIEMDALNAEIEGLKAAQDDEWPKVGDDYWYYSPPYRSVQMRSMDRSDDLDGCDVFGNLFRTKEAAEAYRAWLTDPRTQARRMVETQNGHSDTGHGYAIWFGSTRGDITIQKRDGTVYEGGFNFMTKQQAQAAIDKLGEYLIKVALGVITGDQASEIVLQAMRRLSDGFIR